MLAITGDYLDGFLASTRRKGQSYHRSGAVRSMTCLEPGAKYVAEVAGSAPEPYTVSLNYHPPEGRLDPGGWESECTCPVGFDCKHAYAALLTWMDDFRKTSDTGSPVAGKTNAGLAKTPAPVRETITTRLTKALQRPLTHEEGSFVARLEQVYKECRARNAFLGWDAQALGFRLPIQSWDTLRIWPRFPTDVFEFWNHVAYAAGQDWKIGIPEFMRSITDFDLADAALRQWRREEQIQRWNSLLSGAGEAIHANPVDNLDLRIRILPDRALIEVKGEGQEQFKELKANPAHRLYNQVLNHEVEFNAEVSLLWGIISPRIHYGSGLALGFKDPQARTILSRILHAPVLRSRVVTEMGLPYVFAEDRLKWSLREAADLQDDYGLRLVRADGTLLPPLLLTLPGRLLTCFSADTVFFGPACPPRLDASGAEVLIPAPALESGSGVEFLRGLKVDLPSRLQERVRVVPVGLRIRCELRPSYPGSRTEQCRVQLFAVSSDGVLRESWNGTSWTSGDVPGRGWSSGTGRIGKRSKSSEAQDGIVSYDRSAQAGAPQLLAGLEVKWEGWQGFAQVRVTKKFPEQFVAWHAGLPADVEVDLVGDLASLAKGAVSGSVKLDVTEAGIDWFDLKVILDVSETELSKAEIKLLLDARGGYVRLEGKGWRRLQFNLTDDEDDRLARLGLNPRELTSESQRLHALQLADPAARRFLPEEQFERVQRRASEIQARVTPAIPEGVHAELRPYQCDGFHFLSYLSVNRFGGILADDMGLGKTLQTLTWLKWLRGQPDRPSSPVLVVCPKSVMDNWRSETSRFTPEMRVRVWSATELDQLPGQVESADLHVVNYSQLRLVGESLSHVHWLAAILDEGQYIKNPDSQTAQVARSLRADHRLVLTGTPIENRLMDLWSLMTFAMPGILGSRSQFNRQFDAAEDRHARRRLAARVRPFLLRRTKSQVAKDLPDRIEEDLLCEIEGEQRALYRAELKRAQQMLLKVQTSKQLAKERFHFLTSLLRLRQICCDPRLVKPNSRASSAKVDALIEQLEPLMEEGQKVLVFSQFVTMLDLLHGTLPQRGWPLFYLAGDTENRGELVKKFQAASGPGVFLISLKAGGFGLNLTAASYVFLFDPWWNPAVENQAIDRTHRIGQSQKVIAYRLLIKDSIEEKIRRLQSQKSSLAEDVLGEEKFAQSLTLDDLRFLFTD